MSAINHYEVLGVNSSATQDEIRRAYRILARRYHPDVNPGKASEDRFKLIAHAYTVLSDTKQRQLFDAELEMSRAGPRHAASRAYKSHRRASAQERYFDHLNRNAADRPRSPSPTGATPAPQRDGGLSFGGFFRSLKQFGNLARDVFPHAGEQSSSGPQVRRVSLLEVSVSMRDAITGAKKTVEIEEGEGSRKVSIRIPPGVRAGSVLRMRSKSNPEEELVFVVRVAHHPFLSIQAKGLVVEIPITVQEAIEGASVTVPSLDDPLVLKIPAGTQGGTELRVRERGMLLPDGKRGDLFYRLLIKVPTCYEAVGIKDRATELEKYYEHTVRHNVPKTLLDEPASGAAI